MRQNVNISAFPVAPIPDFFVCLVCGHTSNSPIDFVMRRAKPLGVYYLCCLTCQDEPFPRWKFPALVKGSLNVIHSAP